MTDSGTPEKPLFFEIRRQPNDETCGPTCLHGVYQYFGDQVRLSELLEQVATLEEGGTLGVMLANHALSRGYKAKLVTWNLQIFDPTWFRPDAPPLRERLLLRADAKADPKLRRAIDAYVEFVEAGGEVQFCDLEPALLRRTLERRIPILTGLSATFLYHEARERGTDLQPDDVAGDPVGHFVVLTGYDRPGRKVFVTDPMHPNPLSEVHTYSVGVERVIGAIYLGVLTYDANLVVIEPQDPGWMEKNEDHRRRQEAG